MTQKKGKQTEPSKDQLSPEQLDQVSGGNHTGDHKLEDSEEKTTEGEAGEKGFFFKKKKKKFFGHGHHH